MKCDVVRPRRLDVQWWKKKDESNMLKDTVTYFRSRDGAVVLIWRQIVESVCVHLHLCA